MLRKFVPNGLIFGLISITFIFIYYASLNQNPITEITDDRKLHSLYSPLMKVDVVMLEEEWKHFLEMNEKLEQVELLTTAESKLVKPSSANFRYIILNREESIFVTKPTVIKNITKEGVQLKKTMKVQKRLDSALNPQENAEVSKKETQIPVKLDETLKPVEKVATKKQLNSYPEQSQNLNLLILIYTTLHGKVEWPNLAKADAENFLKNTGCRLQSCRVTYDKEFVSTASAVIFHERDMPGSGVLDMLNSGRKPYQRWVFFTSETPKNSETSIIPYDGLFNLTITYKLDSDIYLPYLYYRKFRENESRPSANINYAANKSLPTAWLVGNCKFFFRMEYVRLLQEYTDVHVGGGCRDGFKKWIDCSRWCEIEHLKPYKFYLAFENGVCTDYITEKYWRYLDYGLVPVVLGGANYSNPRLAIPGSFIDASKFSSIQHLARYLNYLDKNDTAYNEYFKWKQNYKIWFPRNGDWPFESYFLCRLCKILKSDPPKKVYYHLSEFWNPYTDCEVPETRLKERLFPENFDWSEPHVNSEKDERILKAVISKDFDEDFN